MKDTLALQEQVDALGPWCHDLEVAAGVRTRRSAGMSFVDPKITRIGMFAPRVFHGDLGGRSVLDCGCNGGGYSFFARELGAGRCFGFDAREHWINQARFVAEVRGYDDMDFEVCDLYELEAEPADVTFFSGLLYHLPDPVRGLKIAADLTREIIFIDTSARAGMPDGFLAVENEDPELLLSGIHGLNWLPTGPEVLERMLRWVGFVECRGLGYFRLNEAENRLAMVASKVPGQLEHMPDRRKLRQPRHASA